MKIAFYDVTVTNSIGGVQTVVWELAQEFASRGFEVHIYGGHGSIKPKKIHPSIKVLTFPYICRKKVPNLGSRFQRIIERFSMTMFAKKTLREGNYKIVILTKPFDFFVPFLAGDANQTLYAFMSGGTDFFIGDKFLSKKIKLWFACSHFNAWQVMSHYKKEYPTVIYNGVDVEKFKPMPKDTELMESLGIDKNDIVFTYAGRLVGWKGVKYGVEAMSDPRVRSLPVKLLIIGNGPEKKQLKSEVNKLRLNDKVVFLDFITHSNLPKYYAITDVGIYPSIGDEAFGVSIAEAMSCGKPVIAGYIGGIPEVVGTENLCGFLVPPRNASEIADKMILLAENPLTKLKMGKHARQRIVNNFTWKKSANRILKRIEQ